MKHPRTRCRKVMSVLSSKGKDISKGFSVCAHFPKCLIMVLDYEQPLEACESAPLVHREELWRAWLNSRFFGPGLWRHARRGQTPPPHTQKYRYNDVSQSDLFGGSPYWGITIFWSWGHKYFFSFLHSRPYIRYQESIHPSSWLLDTWLTQNRPSVDLGVELGSVLVWQCRVYFLKYDSYHPSSLLVSFIDSN